MLYLSIFETPPYVPKSDESRSRQLMRRAAHDGLTLGRFVELEQIKLPALTDPECERLARDFRYSYHYIRVRFPVRGPKTSVFYD